ncbi:MAG: hypothetical protein KIT09_27075 [Bryobacteraceae bacterium]|nr:hypothetical protein [Bryobacteraceae bacterium]
MADTEPKALEALNELRRRMSASEKLVEALEMAAMLIRACEDRVRKDFPEAGEREIFLHGASLRLGAETVKRVYGWDPDGGQAP